MDNRLLNKLGISAELPADQLLEQLQDKNLEYLERIDSCSDGQRLSELRSTQQQIETMIMSLSTGMTLSRQVQTKTDVELASVQTDPVDAAVPTPRVASAVTYNDALAAFQQGDYQNALPILQGYAEKGDLQACLLTAHILSQQDKDEDTKRYLFTAARQGEDIATLMLAQQYYREENYVSAEKWARKLYEKQYPGSGSLLTSILVLKGMTPEAMDPIIKELEWLQGYERYEQTQRICDYIDKCFKRDVKAALAKKLSETVNGDASCFTLVRSRFGELSTAVHCEKTEKCFEGIKLLISLIYAIACFFVVKSTNYIGTFHSLNVYVISFVVYVLTHIVFYRISRKTATDKADHTASFVGELIFSVIIAYISISVVGNHLDEWGAMIFACASCSGLIGGLIGFIWRLTH